MRTKLLVLCYVLLLACSDKDKVPGNILPKEKMVPVLIDIYMAESKVNNLRIVRDSASAIFEVYEGKLFEKHGISDSAYYRSMSYYYDHPEKLEAIYETLLDSLNLYEQRLKDKEEADIRKEQESKEEIKGKVKSKGKEEKK